MITSRFPRVHTGAVVYAAAVCCSVALILAVVGFYWTGWARLPISIRFICGVIVFGIAPGLLMVGPFLSTRRGAISPLDLVIAVVTCSFSGNLAINVILFALNWNMTGLTHAYTWLQLAGYAVWLPWSARALLREPVATATERQGSPWLTWCWIALVAVAGVMVYSLYLHGAPITNSEELVWLRKLVENPSVRYDNLSYRLGDPSTYLFVPIQIFIAGTSVVGRMDISLAYSLFWPVTTALSIFILARLALVCFGNTEVALVLSAWMVAITVFDPDALTYGAGIVVPYPNRYGFAGGVLLPLTLLLFWAVLRDSRLQIWRWALLVYVVIEITFVHARETLLTVGVVAMVLATMLLRPRRYRGDILRIGSALAFIALVLWAYRKVNLGLAPDLDAFVAATVRECQAALFQLLVEFSPLNLLTVPLTGSLVVDVNGSQPITVTFATYPRIFLDSWKEGYLGRLYLPLAILLWPVYAIRARSIAELSIVAVLAAFAFITNSAFLTLLITIGVGSPEVLIIYNLVALFSALIVCAMACDLAAAIVTAGRGAFVRLRATWAAAGGPAHSGGVLVSEAWLAAIPLIALYVVALSNTNTIIGWRASWFAFLSSPYGWIWPVITVAAVAFRLRRHALPTFAPAPRTTGAGVGLIGVLLVATLLAPAADRSNIWNRNPFTPPYPTSQFTGDLFTDYPMSIAPESKKFDPSPYPVDVIRFLRQEVPVNRTVLASDALGLLQRAPHFAAVLSSQGDVSPQYIVNTAYLRDYPHAGRHFSVGAFVDSAEGRQELIRLLEQFHVDLVVVDPVESELVRGFWSSYEELSTRLRPVYEQQGYIIYAVAGR